MAMNAAVGIGRERRCYVFGKQRNTAQPKGGNSRNCNPFLLALSHDSG
jgi:hypothetical protein